MKREKKSFFSICYLGKSGHLYIQMLRLASEVIEKPFCLWKPILTLSIEDVQWPPRASCNYFHVADIHLCCKSVGKQRLFSEAHCSCIGNQISFTSLTCMNWWTWHNIRPQIWLHETREGRAWGNKLFKSVNVNEGPHNSSEPERRQRCQHNLAANGSPRPEKQPDAANESTWHSRMRLAYRSTNFEWLQSVSGQILIYALRSPTPVDRRFAVNWST